LRLFLFLFIDIFWRYFGRSLHMIFNLFIWSNNYPIFKFICEKFDLALRMYWMIGQKNSDTLICYIFDPAYWFLIGRSTVTRLCLQQECRPLLLVEERNSSAIYPSWITFLSPEIRWWWKYVSNFRWFNIFTYNIRYVKT